VVLIFFHFRYGHGAHVAAVAVFETAEAEKAAQAMIVVIAKPPL